MSYNLYLATLVLPEGTDPYSDEFVNGILARVMDLDEDELWQADYQFTGGSDSTPEQVREELGQNIKSLFSSDNPSVCMTMVGDRWVVIAGGTENHGSEERDTATVLDELSLILP